MDVSTLVGSAQQALVLSLAIAMQDPTISHLPRLLAVAAALAVFGPWMGRQLVAFAMRMFAGG
jgi:flagellar biosynthesis protein FliQ